MRTFTLLFLLPLIFITGSCGKELPFDEDTPVDTLFPKPYFPIYPGSWWTYQNLASSTFYTETAGSYVKKSLQDGDAHSPEYFVPTLNDIPYFQYGVQRTFSSYYVRTPRISYILSETAGDLWTYQMDYVDPRYNSGTEVQRRVDSVGLVKNMDAGLFTDVIRISEVNYRSPYQRNYYYFAKDVGLIEWGAITSTGQNAPTARIDSYFINH